MDKTIIRDSEVFFHLFICHNDALRIFPDFRIQEILFLSQRSAYNGRDDKFFFYIIFFLTLKFQQVICIRLWLWNPQRNHISRLFPIKIVIPLPIHICRHNHLVFLFYGFRQNLSLQNIVTKLFHHRLIVTVHIIFNPVRSILLLIADPRIPLNKIRFLILILKKIFPSLIRQKFTFCKLYFSQCILCCVDLICFRHTFYLIRHRFRNRIFQ